MVRLNRSDAPGVWHHVVNRGVAHRAIFESSAEMRHFLALLALQVRARRLEVHAYCLLNNHFHLLIRSPQGALAQVMHFVQWRYSRWFNARRGRDGPLF